MSIAHTWHNQQIQLYTQELDHYKNYNSNRQQVACSVEILCQAGFRIEPAPAGEDFSDPGFTPEEIEFMAEMEYGRWNEERLRSGWYYDPKKIRQPESAHI